MSKLAQLAPLAVAWGCASAAPSAPAAPSNEATPLGSPSAAATPAPAAPAASGAATPVPALAAFPIITCSTTGDGGKVEVRVDTDTMRGTVAIDGTAKRRFQVHAVPRAGTYVLLFAGYASDDQRPAGETLVAERSIVTRYVADRNDSDLYFDGDVRAGGSAPRRCVR